MAELNEPMIPNYNEPYRVKDTGEARNFLNRLDTALRSAYYGTRKERRNKLQELFSDPEWKETGVPQTVLDRNTDAKLKMLNAIEFGEQEGMLGADREMLDNLKYNLNVALGQENVEHLGGIGSLGVTMDDREGNEPIIFLPGGATKNVALHENLHANKSLMNEEFRVRSLDYYRAILNDDKKAKERTKRFMDRYFDQKDQTSRDAQKLEMRRNALTTSNYYLTKGINARDFWRSREDLSSRDKKRLKRLEEKYDTEESGFFTKWAMGHSTTFPKQALLKMSDKEFANLLSIRGGYTSEDGDNFEQRY